jgi:serine/threonine protein kinase
MNVPPSSFQSNEHAYLHHSHYNHGSRSDASFNQNQPCVDELKGGHCHCRNDIPSTSCGIGSQESVRCHGDGGSSVKDSGGDRRSNRKGSVLWEVARKKLFPDHRSKQLDPSKAVSQEQHGVDLKNAGNTNILPINRIADTSPGHRGNENQLPRQDSRYGSTGVTRMDAHEGLLATIQRLRAQLARSRKVVIEYHEDWEESQIEALKLKEYVRLLKDHIKVLQSQIVCLNQQHSLKHFCQIPTPMTELPFLCPVDLHLPEDCPRVGKYERGRLLGRGQFGIVWEARLQLPTNNINSQEKDGKHGTNGSRKRRNNKEDHVLAIKEIDKGRCLNEYRKLVALNREVQALQICRHPNIIHLVGVVHGPKSFYLVFEKAWIDAHTLHRALTTLPMVTVQHIMTAVFRALQHMHANGVAHLDIKAENILIVHPDPDGRGDDRHAVGMLRAEHVRLGDFGLCVIDSQNGQQQQQHRLQLSQRRQRRQLDHHNTYCHGGMPESYVGDNSSPTASNNAADHHDALGNGMTNGAPSLYAHGCSVIGTPGFYAPEMVERARFDAMAADMWSAGTCLLEFTIGLTDFWWATYEQYGRLRRRRLRRRASQGGEDALGPPDRDHGVHTPSRPLAAHTPAAPAKQSTASSTSSTSTSTLERELYWYLGTQADLEWNDDDLKDLVFNKLMVEPGSRWTASQALGHPWVASRSRGTI